MTFTQTRKSGTRFEEQIVECVSKYTTHIWQNVRVETLLTAQGNTEIDILFIYKDLIFIIEAKNVSAIFGNYNSQMWNFVGSSGSSADAKEYAALNTLTQNGIHAKSFIDAYYAKYKSWVSVMPVVVVPNGCKLDDDIADSVYHLSRLDSELRSISSLKSEDVMHRAVAMMLDDDNKIIRPDFRDDSFSGGRIKVVVRE